MCSKRTFINIWINKNLTKVHSQFVLQNVRRVLIVFLPQFTFTARHHAVWIFDEHHLCLGSGNVCGCTVKRHCQLLSEYHLNSLPCVFITRAKVYNHAITCWVTCFLLWNYPAVEQTLQIISKYGWSVFYQELDELCNLNKRNRPKHHQYVNLQRWTVVQAS